MMGRAHVLTGIAAGLGAGIILHLPAAQDLVLAGYSGGFALLADLDHPCGTEARTYGFITRWLSRGVRKSCGGHRKLTHSLIGVAAFAGIAQAGEHFRHDPAGWVLLGVLMAVTGAGFTSVLISLVTAPRVIRRQRASRLARRHAAHLAEAAGIILAGVTVALGLGLSLILPAVITGCAAHIAGDMLTKQRCPLLYPFLRTGFGLLPRELAFTTNTRPENLGVVPAAIVAIVALALDALHPGLVMSAAHHLAALR